MIKTSGLSNLINPNFVLLQHTRMTAGNLAHDYLFDQTYVENTVFVDLHGSKNSISTIRL